MTVNFRFAPGYFKTGYGTPASGKTTVDGTTRFGVPLIVILVITILYGRLPELAIKSGHGIGFVGGLFSAVERFTSMLSPGSTRAPARVEGSPGYLANTMIAA